MKKIIKAFTLVELIVVITILAVLSTIAFISFQGYASNSRDSVRLADMNNISKGMNIKIVKAEKLPIPDDKIDITASGTLLNYQGYAGQQTLGNIEVHGGGVDPLDQSFYTYSTNVARNKFQLLGFFENEDNISFNKNVYADLSDRYPTLKGSKLGIFIDSITKYPIQGSNNNIDVVNTVDTFRVYINNKGFINGSGSELKKIINIQKYGNIDSCKSLLKYNDFKDKSGVYTIHTSDQQYIDIYCDMVTDGGGWSLIFNQSAIGDFWDGNNETYNIFGNTDCIGFEENCVNRIYSQLNIGTDLMFDGAQSNIIENNYTSRYIINGINNINKKTFFEIMNDSSPNINCKFNIGSVDIVIKKDPVLASGDSNSIVNIGGSTTCLNDLSNANGYKFFIGRLHTNQAGWPSNSYSNHFHQNYRVWTR